MPAPRIHSADEYAYTHRQPLTVHNQTSISATRIVPHEFTPDKPPVQYQVEEPGKTIREIKEKVWERENAGEPLYEPVPDIFATSTSNDSSSSSSAAPNFTVLSVDSANRQYKSHRHHEETGSDGNHSQQTLHSDIIESFDTAFSGLGTKIREESKRFVAKEKGSKDRKGVEEEEDESMDVMEKEKKRKTSSGDESAATGASSSAAASSSSSTAASSSTTSSARTSKTRRTDIASNASASGSVRTGDGESSDKSGSHSDEEEVEEEAEDDDENLTEWSSEDEKKKKNKKSTASTTAAVSSSNKKQTPASSLSNRTFAQLRTDAQRRRRRVKIPFKSVEILSEWFRAHVEKPYPTDLEKLMLMEKAGLDDKQVVNWFTNTRKRFWEKHPTDPSKNRLLTERVEQAPTKSKKGTTSSSTVAPEKPEDLAVAAQLQKMKTEFKKKKSARKGKTKVKDEDEDWECV